LSTPGNFTDAVRIIKESALLEFARLHPEAAAGVEFWRKVVRAARWSSLVEVRRTLPHADSVVVASGRTVVVFNVAENKFRLVVALHYRFQIAYVLRGLTHADYSKNRWKEEL
jgi:mRNA interferase HigB